MKQNLDFLSNLASVSLSKSLLWMDKNLRDSGSAMCRHQSKHNQLISGWCIWFSAVLLFPVSWSHAAVPKINNGAADVNTITGENQQWNHVKRDLREKRDCKTGLWELVLTLKVLNFWKFTSYCSLKPLWSGMGEVVLAYTSLNLHPPSPPTVHQLLGLAL